MSKRVSYNKILENEFTMSDNREILEGVISGNYPEGYMVDVGEDQLEPVKPVYAFSIFKDNEEIAYGKVNVDTAEVRCGGSYNEAVNDVVEGAIYNTSATLEGSFNELISVIDGVLNHPVEESEPKSLDPLDIIRSAEDQETLDTYAHEYLMDDEYDLYIESKPDATFEDNKNYVIYLLTNDPYLEKDEPIQEGSMSDIDLQLQEASSIDDLIEIIDQIGAKHLKKYVEDNKETIAFNAVVDRIKKFISKGE